MSALRSDPSIAPQEVYTASTTQQTDIGARFTTGDGRVFRYCSVGSTTALVAGLLYQSAQQDTSNFQLLGTFAAAGTGTFVVTTGSSVTLTANQLAGGLLTVRRGSGNGFAYGIKSHPAVTSGTVSFTLSDPLQIALATTSVFDVTPNPYANVIVAPTTLTGTPVGVATANGTNASFTWLQTRGLCPVKTATVVTVGNMAVPSTGTAGYIAAYTTVGSLPIVATAAITTLATNDAQPFFLTLE